MTIFTADEKGQEREEEAAELRRPPTLGKQSSEGYVPVWQSEATTLKLQGGTLLMDSRQKTGRAGSQDGGSGNRVEEASQ